MQTASGLLLPDTRIALPRVEFPRLLRGLGDALDRMMPLGGMLGPLGVASRVAAVNWWEAGGATGAVGVYQPKGAASLAASYVNLANPGTNNAAPGVAPTFNTATGWTFNGSTQYLTTGLTAAANQTWSVLVRFSNATVPKESGLIDGRSGTARFSLFNDFNNGNHYFQTGTGSLAVAGALTSGVMAMAGTTAYLDGSSQGTIGGSAGLGTTIIIGSGRAAGGVIVYFFSGKIQAVAIYNATLTPGQVAAITTAMQAL